MRKIYQVEPADEGMRIDRWLKNNIGKFPQSLIEKSLRNGKIKINNKKIKSSFKISAGDDIYLFNINYKEQINYKKEKFIPSKKIVKSNEELVLEDNENFVVINKAAGISVQGGTKSKKNLIDIFAKSKIFNDSKPYSVHRLDKDTSGVFIIAKNRNTAQLLTSLFRLRKIHKTYLALCYGEIIDSRGQWVDSLIKYENNKKIFEKAITSFKVIDKNNLSTFLELKPITGRKHQLRKQLFNKGNPIFGDNKYKIKSMDKTHDNKLMLHAYQIKFMINEKKFTYTAPIPDYFKKLIKVKRLNIPNYLKNF